MEDENFWSSIIYLPVLQMDEKQKNNHYNTGFFIALVFGLKVQQQNVMVLVAPSAQDV